MVSQETISGYLQKIKYVQEEIMTGAEISPEIFKLSEFWEKISDTSQKISFSCTKFCLSFGKLPSPSESEARSQLDSLMGILSILRDTVHQLPKKYGAELHYEVTTSSGAMVLAVAHLVTLALQRNTAALDSMYRQITARAWEACVRILALPRNNTHAVLMASLNQQAVVDDAYREISEAMEGDGSDSYNLQLSGMDMNTSDMAESWSLQDKEKLKSAVNIVKGIKLLYKRTVEALRSSLSSANADTDSVSNLALWMALDKLREEMRDLPENVDDTVLAMYPSVDYAALAKICHDTVSRGVRVVTMIQQCGAGDERTPQQLAFLHTALTHNLASLDNAIAG